MEQSLITVLIVVPDIKPVKRSMRKIKRKWGGAMTEQTTLEEHTVMYPCSQCGSIFSHPNCRDQHEENCSGKSRKIQERHDGKLRTVIELEDRTYVVDLDPSIDEEQICLRTEAFYEHEGKSYQVSNVNTLMALHDKFMEMIDHD